MRQKTRDSDVQRSSLGARARLAMAGLVAAALMLPAPCFGQSAAPGARDRTRRVVLVSIADRRLAVMENGNLLAYFPVAVGAAASPSPIGEFEIVNRVTNPAYYHDGLVMAAGKDNPVGTRWMGLNVKGYGIHGTNAPKSVGGATSHGCIRLKNGDIERLYAMLRVGDLVKIREDRDEEIAAVFGGEVDVDADDDGPEAAGQ